MRQRLATVLVLALFLTACSGLALFNSQPNSGVLDWMQKLRTHAGGGIVKCGDSQFVSPLPIFIFEYKGLNLAVESAKLSPADQANGIEWRGRVVTQCTMVRVYDCDRPADIAKLGKPTNCKPRPWMDCLHTGENLKPVQPAYVIRKEKGAWYYDQNPIDFVCAAGENCITLSCDDISKASVN